MDHFFLPLLLKGLQQVGSDLVHLLEQTDGVKRVGHFD